MNIDAHMKSIVVYCGSKVGKKPAYALAAKQLGKYLAKNDFRLVYGGGSVGLMGVVADAALENGGKVVGVIPRFLDNQEVGHQGISELIVVEDMHTRKQKMTSLSQGAIALPGGLGTLEELSEVLTWDQLRLIQRPIGLLNVDGFYDPLLQQLDHMVSEGFLSRETRSKLLVDSSVEELMRKMEVGLSKKMENDFQLRRS